jgi:hypothetical protein
MKGLADLKAWTPEVLVGSGDGERGTAKMRARLGRELIPVGLLVSGVVLVLGVNLGRWFLAG